MRINVTTRLDGSPDTVVQGFASSVPGLAITPRIAGSVPLASWVLTHIATGYSLGVFFASAAEAGWFAQSCRTADWLSTRTEAQRTALEAAMRRGLARDHDGSRHGKRMCPCCGSDLAWFARNARPA